MVLVFCVVPHQPDDFGLFEHHLLHPFSIAFQSRNDITALQEVMTLLIKGFCIRL